MPVFKVLRRVDAFIDSVAEVEASSPEAAAALARKREEHFRWAESDVNELDARLFVTLDSEGNEIESTQCGDF